MVGPRHRHHLGAGHAPRDPAGSGSARCRAPRPPPGWAPRSPPGARCRAAPDPAPPSRGRGGRRGSRRRSRPGMRVRPAGSGRPRPRGRPRWRRPGRHGPRPPRAGRARPCVEQDQVAAGPRGGAEDLPAGDLGQALVGRAAGHDRAPDGSVGTARVCVPPIRAVGRRTPQPTYTVSGISTDGPGASPRHRARPCSDLRVPRRRPLPRVGHRGSAVLPRPPTGVRVAAVRPPARRRRGRRHRCG